VKDLFNKIERMKCVFKYFTSKSYRCEEVLTDKKRNSSSFFTKLSFTLFVSLYVFVGWGQYTGTGTFEKINSLGELTDGYYVVLESNEAQAMNNTHNGTFLGLTGVSPSSDEITNPATSDVWLIENNGSGKTIYSEASSKYVSYTGSSNNVQIVNDVTSNNQRWNITYSSNTFVFNNVQVSSRILQYNASSPRFACYTSNQRKFSLYKLASVAAKPEPTNHPTSFACSGGSSLTWTDATGTQLPDGYLIKWSDVSYTAITSPTDGSTANGANSTTVNQGEESASIVGLDPNTTYYYKIWSYTNSGSDIDYKTNGTVQETDCSTPAGPCFEESFNNAGNVGSYGTRTWTGDSGDDWTATDARSDQSLDGDQVILLRNGSLTNDNPISGGMGVISFNYARIFSGNSTLKVFVNGIQYGGNISVSSESSSLFTTVVNVSGNIELEIENSGNRTIISNLEWTCFAGAPAPEINLQGNSVDIPDGNTAISAGDNTDFGGVLVASGTNPNTFTIQNTGTADLNLTSVTSSNATEFAVSGTTSGVIADGGSATFTVTFDPNAIGTMIRMKERILLM